MEKGFPLYIENESVGTWKDKVYTPPLDPLKELVGHWIKGRLFGPAVVPIAFHTRNRGPFAGSNINPWKPGTKAYTTKTERACGYYPAREVITYGMTPNSDISEKNIYQQQIKAVAAAALFTVPSLPTALAEVSPYILPHTHVALLDENGNGYTISTDVDFSFVTEYNSAATITPGPKALEDFLRGFYEMPGGAEIATNTPIHTLPYHTHKVINWKTQPTEAVNQIGTEVIDGETKPKFEPQSHNHFDIRLVAPGARSGTETEIKKWFKSINEYKKCDLISIEAVNLHMNKEALLEAGIGGGPFTDLPPPLDEVEKFKDQLALKAISWLDDNFNETGFYLDHTFQTYYPLEPLRAIKYNYNQEIYEKAAKKLIGTEFLPSLYSLAFAEQHPEIIFPSSVDAFWNILSLNGKITSPLPGFNFTSLNQYFKEWAKVAEGGLTAAPLVKQRNILYDHTGELIRNQYNDRRNIFPMYSELFIDTLPNKSTKPGFFVKYFADPTSKFDANNSYAIRWLMEKMIDKVTVKPPFHINAPMAGWGTFEEDFYRQDGSLMTSDKFRIWNMSSFVNCPDNLLPVPIEAVEHKIDDAIVLTGDSEFIKSPEVSLNAKLYQDVFNYEIDAPSSWAGGTLIPGIYTELKKAHNSELEESLYKGLFRCMQDIYTGKHAYSEILFFKIEKYDADANKLLQSFWIPQPVASGLIDFVDTQIKYADSYQYKVLAYALVTGNQYKYLGHVDKFREFDQPTEDRLPSFAFASTPLAWDPQLDGETLLPVAEVVIENKPSVYLMEIPYISFATIGVVDAPPMPPDVQIVPYKNVNDKMLFLLNQNFGEIDEFPIIIESEDTAKFELNFKAQNPMLSPEPIVSWFFEIKSDIESQKIHFKTDDYIKQYQVFRIDKKPTSYKDFAGSLRQPPLELKQDAFVDTLVPNKKYYYTFRAVDIHGNISNPTPVYEVESVFNSGATYPIIKVVDFEPILPQVKEKPMRRFVHIIPSFAQSKMDDIPYEYAPGFFVVNENFGDVFSDKNAAKPKRFKIRFTSKSTGRKFDLNLKVLHEKEHDARWKKYLEKKEQESLMASEELKDKKWLEEY